MFKKFYRAALLISATVLMAGCGTTKEIVVQPVDCSTGLSEADLKFVCAQPTGLKLGMTYEQLLRLSANEKADLKICGEKVALLQSALHNCTVKAAQAFNK